MFCLLGILWSDMHLLANKVMLEELKKIDLVRGDVDEMMEVSLAQWYFQGRGKIVQGVP